MWKRDEAVRSVPQAGGQSSDPKSGGEPPALATRGGYPSSPVNIGKSVVIKGELNGSEDLTIDGQVEGKIELRQHILTIGSHGKVRAQVFAKSVVVLGEVTGNITATDKVDIRDAGSVDGDLVSPRVAIAEGAHFRGSIDMQRTSAAAPGQAVARAGGSKPDIKPAVAAAQRPPPSRPSRS